MMMPSSNKPRIQIIGTVALALSLLFCGNRSCRWFSHITADAFVVTKHSTRGKPASSASTRSKYGSRPSCGYRHCCRLLAATSSSSSSATSYDDETKQGGAAAAVAPDHPASNIRNCALIGHSHSGKTTIADWMLYDERIVTKRPSSSVTTSAGEDHQNRHASSASSMLDTDPSEVTGHRSVFSHFFTVPHHRQNGDGCRICITDTPWQDFPADAMASANGADSALLVVSAADGVQSGTISAYHHCQHVNLPFMIVLSKMDRPLVNVNAVEQDIATQLGVGAVPLQVPIFDDATSTFQGVVSLLVLDEDGLVKKNDDEDLEDAWQRLEEVVAMTSDDLLSEYLETGELLPRQVIDGLRVAVRDRTLVPLVFTAAEQDIGIMELLDSIVAVLPDPVETRTDALLKAHDNAVPGQLEDFFSARVIHTIVDAFGSLSVLRVISNHLDSPDDERFDGLPNEVVNLRTGEKIKLPSTSASFTLMGKDRLPCAGSGKDGDAGVAPGDVIAVKLGPSVQTNDVLALSTVVGEEEEEISAETSAHALTALSRPADVVPLMSTATVTVVDGEGPADTNRKSGGRRGKHGGKGGDDKLSSALAALAREDIAMKVGHDSESGKLLIHGMSGDHLRVIAARLKNRYGVDVELGRPSVQYRETIVKTVQKVEGRHKKQSGGSGQFGVCYIKVEPVEEGLGVEFVSKIKGGAITKPLINSVEKGVREQLQAGGPLAGYPVTDVRVTLTDGKMHSVDSKDIAFQSAGRLAVKAALEKGGTRLLQPMDKIVFKIDEQFRGEVNTIVSRLGGYVTSTLPSTAHGLSVLEMEAVIATASVAAASEALWSGTGGEGQYTAEFSHYQPVADHDLDGILTARSSST